MQTCGLCTEPGYNVPHPTMTCYDEYKNCDAIARDGCWRPENQRKCCLSCGLGTHLAQFRTLSNMVHMSD